MKLSFARCLFLIFSCLGSEKAFSQNIPFGFFRNLSDKIVITTAAQTVNAGNCSGITTLQYQGSNSVAKNVTSNLTINITAAAALTYYSDSACLTSTTSVTILTGTSSASFYFISATTGVKNIAATASTSFLASQNETVNTNLYVWTGGGANANWSTAGNWSGGTLPGSGNVAVFDSTCASNCSPTITANMNVAGVRINSGFTGTITQNSGFTITVGASGWVQFAGIFVGSAGADAITINGPVAFSGAGASFTATPGTMQANGTVFSVTNSANFVANGGTLQFNQPFATTLSITPGTITYKNLIISGNQSTYNLNSGTMNISGDLSLIGANNPNGINSGNLSVSGNLTSSGTGARGSGISISLTGNVAGQTITGSSSAYIPSLVIAAGANAVTFSGILNIWGAYTFTSGALSASGAMLNFACDTFSSGCSGTQSISVGSEVYGNVKVTGIQPTYTLNSGTMKIGGSLTLAGVSGGATILNSGTLEVSGDLNASGGGAYGSAVVKIIGNASGQTLTSVSGANIPGLIIVAGANSVTYSGTINVYGAYTFTSGNLSASGSTLNFVCNGFNPAPCNTIVSLSIGSEVYGNLGFIGIFSRYNLNSGTLNIGGNLTLADAHPSALLNSGTLAVAGNVSVSSSGDGGSAQLLFNGNSAQSITVTGGNLPTGNVTINNSAGITLGSNLSWNGASQSTAVTSGNISMAGYSLTLKALSLNSNTVTKSGGVLSVNSVTVGTGSLYGGTVNP